MKEKAKVLIFDDDTDSLDSIATALRRDGFEVHPFADPKEGLSHLASEGGDVVLTDLKMPGITGMEVVRRVVQEYPAVPVVVVTAFGTVESAVEAIRAGASDFLLKPVGIPQLRAAVFKAAKERSKNVELERKDREIRRLREEKTREQGLGRITGDSRKIKEMIQKIHTVAQTRMNVLILGESGTGKELVARAIHDESPRWDNSFLPINCAAIPASLLESELFGHEKGAFTGAVAARPGMMEIADGGTLFLDEVGEMSLALQVKLLRAIEQKEVIRVGGSEVIRVDVRIIAATNQDLKAKVASRTFREDLFYRLNVFGITVPPLRERRDDIPKLAAHLLGEVARENNVTPRKLSPGARIALLAYQWPGNVRELRNAMETAALVAKEGTIEWGDLPPEILENILPPSSTGPIPLPPSRTLEETEREAIVAALLKTDGNKTQAAKMLGIGLRTLHRKVKEYGIS
ncbi:MAG: sigma-54 dependent transcriptional regulator [Candidatus Deferrimicrobiaceae bacterium]